MHEHFSHGGLGGMDRGDQCALVDIEDYPGASGDVRAVLAVGTYLWALRPDGKNRLFSGMPHGSRSGMGNRAIPGASARLG